MTGGSHRSRPGAYPLAEAESRIEPLFVTVEEFAGMAKLSRRQIDRLRVRRPAGFPKEYELGSSNSMYRRCPRFKLSDVLAWLDTRALW